MPEVFTEENKKLHSSLRRKGEYNGRAVMNWEDVRKMRKLKEEGLSNKEIQSEFPQYKPYLINTALRGETWKE